MRRSRAPLEADTIDDNLFDAGMADTSPRGLHGNGRCVAWIEPGYQGLTLGAQFGLRFATPHRPFFLGSRFPEAWFFSSPRISRFVQVGRIHGDRVSRQRAGRASG